ncbi:MAG: FAD synthetase family protein [Bacteroidales bacterium]|jgi:riboflavin kinase/FMN adenylyltransferase|nr:FAD synthetase family protein [Bacteroidales bacterium]
MQILKNNLPQKKVFNAVVSIGVFDGVHIGHVAIVKKMRQIATQIGGKSVIITFLNHPRCLFDPDFEFHTITNETQKNALLEHLGVDIVVYLDFTKQLANMSYFEFLQWISSQFEIHTMVLGYNHCFGKNREGNILNISKIAPKFGFELIVIEQQYANGIAVSSSRIRQAIESDDISLANSMLGRNQY